MTTPLVAQVVVIDGADAIAFAHAQFSSHVTALARGQWQFSAWLDARGRVRALFHLARSGDERLLLLLRGGDATTLAGALQRYVFRAKVRITAAKPRTLGTGPALPLHAFADDDTAVFGCGDHRLILGAGEGDTLWELQQLRAGWPWLPSSALEAWPAPALSLQRLQAVVTDKGCYPGQEIIARLHFRGGCKRHLHSVVLSRPLAPGARLHIDGADIGCTLNVVSVDDRVEALLVLADAAADQAINGRLDVPDENIVITLQRTWPA